MSITPACAASNLHRNILVALRLGKGLSSTAPMYLIFHHSFSGMVTRKCNLVSVVPKLLDANFENVENKMLVSMFIL